VKIASDQLVGVPSQCFLSTESGLEPGAQARNRDAYLYNLTLKMNAKMGGLHSTLYTPPGQSRIITYPVIGEKPFMVMGADLTHPPPGSEDQRSAVGVVASMDQYLSQYALHGMVQEKTEKGREVIIDLKEAVKALLLQFYRRNNQKKPESIIFYRDGVSQGEFPKVIQHEYTAIKTACAEMGDRSADYNPRVTFITVQKRHNIRFFSSDPADLDESGNNLPGTIVDTHICNPHGFDFYLISHTGIQGTSRPALYSVLVDENEFDANSLQLLTYWICHVFCRCTRSVSYCPPAYYAHHAAARCKILHLNGRNKQQPVHPNVAEKLFFI
jgi:eukaryotic translation initiation factor 2C